MNKEKLNEQKEILLEDFNFEQIQNVFKLLGIKVENRTPTTKELVKIANICFDKVIESNQEEQTVSMYGFEVEKLNNELELRFVLQRVNLLGKHFGKNNQTKKDKKLVKNI